MPLVVELVAGSSGEDGLFWWRAAHVTDGSDLAQEGECGATAIAGEGDGFREFWSRFAEFSELEADEEASLAGGGAEEAVVPDAGEAFWEDVKEPASNELVRVKSHHRAASGGTRGPAQAQVALLVVAKETLGAEGAAPEVAGEVAQGGVAASSVLELHVPDFCGTQDVELSRSELAVDLGMIVLQGGLKAAAESRSKRAVVNKEVVFGGMDEGSGGGIESNGGDDEMNVRMVLDLTPPGVKHADEASARAMVVGGDEVLEGGGAFA